MTSDSNQSWYDPEGTTFGDRLAGARTGMGLSQEEFAERLGVRLETVEDWENDVSEPRGNRLTMMAGVMNVSIRWLLTGQGDGPSDTAVEMGILQVKNSLRDTRAQMMMLLDRLGRLEEALVEQSQSETEADE